MPLVRIEVLKGRPASERKQLQDAVHDALVEAFGIPEDDRTQRLIEHDRKNFEVNPGPLVVLHEPPMQNWGIRGGRSADEVELGYASMSERG
jgi:phenylpyruvate tautomerase PptA (4-oxalocrotonate tautomerase family)